MKARRSNAHGRTGKLDGRTLVARADEVSQSRVLFVFDSELHEEFLALFFGELGQFSFDLAASSRVVWREQCK